MKFKIRNELCFEVLNSEDVKVYKDKIEKKILS